MPKIATYLLLIVFTIPKVAAAFELSPLLAIQQKIEKSCTDKQTCYLINKMQLPPPFDFLLTQPLMTLAIEQFYQRTAIIQTYYAKQQNDRYLRIILMFVDSNKERNDAKLAQKNHEAIIVELAFITMNFNELPIAVKSDVLTTNIPFGKSLSLHHVPIKAVNRRYFAINCNRPLASLVHCTLNKPLYGRTNTLVNTTNKQWLARTIEIATGASDSLPLR